MQESCCGPVLGPERQAGGQHQLLPPSKLVGTTHRRAANALVAPLSGHRSRTCTVLLLTHSFCSLNGVDHERYWLRGSSPPCGACCLSCPCHHCACWLRGLGLCAAKDTTFALSNKPPTAGRKKCCYKDTFGGQPPTHRIPANNHYSRHRQATHAHRLLAPLHQLAAAWPLCAGNSAPCTPASQAQLFTVCAMSGVSLGAAARLLIRAQKAGNYVSLRH